MIRQIAFQQPRTNLTRALLIRSSQPSVLMTSYRHKHTVVDSAKETLSALNKKIGEYAASSIEKAEDATESLKETDLTGKAKSGLDAVNKKVGKAAASGIESAESVAKSTSTQDVTGKAKSAADAVNKKAGKVAADAIDASQGVAEASKGTWEDAKQTAKAGYEENVEGASKQDLQSKAKETYNRAKETAKELAFGEDDTKHFGSSTLTAEDLLSEDHPVEGSHHVKENIKGYKSLQHKGKKAYSEQNRPEDFM